MAQNNLGTGINNLVQQVKPNFTDEEKQTAIKGMLDRHLRDLGEYDVKPYSVDEGKGQILFKTNGDDYEIIPNHATKLGNYDVYKNGGLLKHDTDFWNKDIWSIIRDNAKFNKRK